MVSSTADVQNQILNTLFLLQVRSAMPLQMQDAIGFSHRLCSITFPLYDNRMCGIFQCVQTIFPIENTGQDAVIIHVTMLMCGKVTHNNLIGSSSPIPSARYSYF